MVYVVGVYVLMGVAVAIYSAPRAARDLERVSRAMHFQLGAVAFITALCLVALIWPVAVFTEMKRIMRRKG